MSQQPTNQKSATGPTKPEKAQQTPKKPAQFRQVDEHLRKLTDTLKKNLAKCAHDPDEDAVHDTRTGTRRIEATLEAALRDAGLESSDGQGGISQAARSWERLLKTIRRAAAPVRDLDVQRKILKSLIPVVEGDIKIPVNEPESGLAGQIDKLDDALKAEREDCASRLKKNAAKWAGKLDSHLEVWTNSDRPRSRKSKTDAAATALDAFARLANQMRQLDAGNLHDFRKGAKKARYMAEQGGDDERAGAVGKALKKLQDEIGDWHDWLMLSDEAHKYLNEEGALLITEIERMRDVHFEMAMEMERKMRGRLMGEWISIGKRPRSVRQAPAPAIEKAESTGS